MQFLQISLVALLSSIVAADVDINDVPVQCQAICQSAVQISQNCDRQFNNNDAGELNCVCTAANANVTIPACEACVSTFDVDRSDNDVNDLVRSCSFTTTTYNSASAAPSVTGSGGATFSPTATGSTTVTRTNSAGSTVVSTGTVVAGTVVSTTGASGPTNTPNAAAGFKGDVAKAGVWAMGVVGFMGLL